MSPYWFPSFWQSRFFCLAERAAARVNTIFGRLEKAKTNSCRSDGDKHFHPANQKQWMHACTFDSIINYRFLNEFAQATNHAYLNNPKQCKAESRAIESLKKLVIVLALGKWYRFYQWKLSLYLNIFKDSKYWREINLWELRDTRQEECIVQFVDPSAKWTWMFRKSKTKS